MSLKNYSIYSEVVTLSFEEKGRVARNFHVSSLNGTRTLIWPSFPLGKLHIAARFITRTHFMPMNSQALQKYMRNFDILHFHDDVDLSFPLFAIPVKKPKIFTCHSLPYWLSYYRRNILARTLLTKSASLYHVFSKIDKESLSELGIPRDSIRVVPHGVDTSVFKPAKEKHPRLTYNIILVGRIARNKGTINLLKAISILKESYSLKKNLAVQIVGQVWDHDYYLQLLEYKKVKQLQEVSFVGLAENLLPLLNNADVFVSTSLQETFGIVNLEAMASGLPVVATDVGPIPEIVLDNYTGFIVPPNDPVALAEKLNLLIGDEKLQKRMGHEGRKRVEQLFSLSNVTEMMVDLYNEVM
jgi:glycosyltransferase involved in cell wall biosynthesis